MINEDRLLNTLAELRTIGQCKTGVVRPAFSHEDVVARLWLADKLKACGLNVHIDAVGNVFGIPEGEEPCLLLGSHTDTQPEGGWLDGALGVIAALEIARSLHEQGEKPVAVVSFQDEEGRFGSTTGSRLWTQKLSLNEADNYVDADGISFKEARTAFESSTTPSMVSINRFTGFLELHIEKGPFLIDSEDLVGVVDRIVGVRQYLYRFSGEQNHAGTTPMHKRRDAFRALSQLSSTLDAVLTPIATPATVWTIGQVDISPNAASIVPGMAEFILQWRDTDEERLDNMELAINQLVDEVAGQFDIDVTKEEMPRVYSAAMDPPLCNALENAAKQITQNRYRRMPSAAIHDAGIVSQVLPSAMLFCAIYWWY